jgi:hypothetical protein
VVADQGTPAVFVGSEQHAAALLTQVQLPFEVDGVQLLPFTHEFRHVAGDEVLMLHGQNRQLDADHASHFAGPQSRGVHHILGMYIAVVGDDIPGSVAARLEIGHAGVSDDFRAAELCGFGVGMRDAIRIDMALDGIVHRALKMLFVQQRKESGRLIDGYDFKIHSQISTARLGHLQPVQPLARACQHQAAGDVHAA